MVCTAHGVHLHAGLHTAHGGHLCAGVLDCTRSAWWCGHGVLQPIYRRRSFIGVSLASLQFQFTQYCAVANSQSLYTILNNIFSQLENTERGGRYDIYRWDLIVCGLILCGTIYSVVRSDCSIG